MSLFPCRVWLISHTGLSVLKCGGVRNRPLSVSFTPVRLHRVHWGPRWIKEFRTTVRAELWWEKASMQLLASEVSDGKIMSHKRQNGYQMWENSFSVKIGSFIGRKFIEIMFYFETFSVTCEYSSPWLQPLRSFDVLNMHAFECLLLCGGVHWPRGVCVRVCLWGEGGCLCEL